MNSLDTKLFYRNLNLGILGGGQLGRMLLQASISLDICTHVLDPDSNAPARRYCTHFTKGDFTDYDAVMAFGAKLDIITIEIENVNTRALKDLEKLGKKVYPSPQLIETIQDKGLQKQFYTKYNMPTAAFQLIDTIAELKTKNVSYPSVLKMRTEGYDGKGVLVLNAETDSADVPPVFDRPGIVEEKINIDKEISVIVCRNENGQIAIYPAVEMVFHEANLLDYLVSPARIGDAHAEQARQVAKTLAESIRLVGIMAVELFIDTTGKLYINESAPRAHNSGHHTIEASYCSQYNQLLRMLLGQAPGDTAILSPSVMINLIGEPGYEGEPVYTNVEEVLAIPGVYLHLYGKAKTRPNRKMGHVTILAKDIEEALKKAYIVKQKLKVIA